jgi:hypothetical protein
MFDPNMFDVKNISERMLALKRSLSPEEKAELRALSVKAMPTFCDVLDHIIVLMNRKQMFGVQDMPLAMFIRQARLAAESGDVLGVIGQSGGPNVG